MQRPAGDSLKERIPVEFEYIGRYEVRDTIGKGGMGQVYRAHDPRFARDVAVKVLAREYIDEPSLHERFTREAQSIAALEHASIVPVYDFGESDGRPYLVMRFMRGGTLEERLRAGSLSIDDCLGILDRVAMALEAAHAHGLVHRDVKPANVLFDEYGAAYLSDFGIVRMTTATTLTGVGGSIGTPEYMSPEQARGEGVTHKSDIYSLATMAFRMLTGRLPFSASNPIAMLLLHSSEEAPAASSVNPSLPPECDAAFARALAKDPDERYESVTDFVAGLRESLGSTGSGTGGGAQARAGGGATAGTGGSAQPSTGGRDQAASGGAGQARDTGGSESAGGARVPAASDDETSHQASEELVTLTMQPAKSGLLGRWLPGRHQGYTVTVHNADSRPADLTLTALPEREDVQLSVPQTVHVPPNSEATFKVDATLPASAANEPTSFTLAGVGGDPRHRAEAQGQLGRSRLGGPPMFAIVAAVVAIVTGGGLAIWAMGGSGDADDNGGNGPPAATETGNGGETPDPNGEPTEAPTTGPDDATETGATAVPEATEVPRSEAVAWVHRDPEGSEAPRQTEISDPSGDIFLHFTESGEQRPLIPDDGEFDDRQPAISPDGAHVAFSSDREGTFDIWVVRVDGTGLQQVTDSPDHDFHPDWSPDGSAIVFQRRDLPTGDIQENLFATPVEQGESLAFGDTFALVTDEEADLREPAFSPDGSVLVWARGVGGANFDLWRGDVSGEGPNLSVGGVEPLLPDATGDDVNPDWSPDGSTIVFHKVVNGLGSIAMLDVGSGEETIVLSGAGLNFREPVFSPDGSRIIYDMEDRGDPGSDLDIFAVPRDGFGVRESDARELVDQAGVDTWSDVGLIPEQ